jgi:RimJ/RimL family protein N-acetyltransferase
MFEILQYEKFDFPILKQWFIDFEWTICDERTIAKNAFFVFHDGTPVAFSNFAETDTNVCILGFTITNKNIDKSISREAVDKLMVFLFARAKELGYDYIHYATDNVPMVKRLERLGLMQVTDNATGYLLTGSLTGNSIAFFDE